MTGSGKSSTPSWLLLGAFQQTTLARQLRKEEYYANVLHSSQEDRHFLAQIPSSQIAHALRGAALVKCTTLSGAEGYSLSYRVNTWLMWESLDAEMVRVKVGKSLRGRAA